MGDRPPPDRAPIVIPLYLYALLALVLAFFAAHGKTIAVVGGAEYSYSPWYLPKGFFRILVVAGTAAVVAWEFYSNPDLLLQRLTPKPEQLGDWPNIILSLGAGFLAGWLAHLGPWRNSPAGIPSA